MTERIVWQPVSLYQPGRDFAILLSKKFAKEMLEAKISNETRRRTNEIGAEMLKNNYKMYWLEPFEFYEDTAFVSSFHLGDNGKWLSICTPDPRELLRENEPFKYHSHNVDTVIDAHALMALVDMYAEYADIIKTKKYSQPQK